MRTLGFVISLAVFIVVSTGGAASANLVTYSDLSHWQAAVPGESTVTIPDVTTDPFYEYFGTGDATYSYGGLTFSTSSAISDGNFYNLGTGFTGNSEAVLSSQDANTGVANIRISFGTEIHGIAFNYGTFKGDDVTFTLSNGDFIQLSSPSGDQTYSIPNFVGITDAQSFSSVLVTAAPTDDALVMNNFSFYVPEPSTFVLLGLGGACLGFRFYRRRQNLK